MPSDIFSGYSAYSLSSQWMKLAEKNKNLTVETYTHAQSYSTDYKNGAQNIKAKESYGYDIRGPSGRVKEKKSSGFDGTRAANGKIEGEAWRHKTDGFSDETFNNGFNVGKRLENPFGSPRRIENAFPSSPLRPRALDDGPPSRALERGLVPGLSNGPSLSWTTTGASAMGSAPRCSVPTTPTTTTLPSRRPRRRVRNPRARWELTS
jgi:hypothetical protein